MTRNTCSADNHERARQPTPGLQWCPDCGAIRIWRSPGVAFESGRWGRWVFPVRRKSRKAAVVDARQTKLFEAPQQPAEPPRDVAVCSSCKAEHPITRESQRDGIACCGLQLL